MVVLSIALCTKTGKPLLARQYVEMSRLRLEGLIAAFPKLVGTGQKQHTFVDTENCRYVYHPLDQLYLLLITNKGSNIVEDLETLRLLSKVVPDQCGGLVSEEKIAEVAFELMMALDEVVSAGGYSESTTMQQIKTNLEMESHEERLAIMIKQSKMNEAQLEGKRKAAQLKEAAKEAARLNKAGMGGGGGGMGGMGGGSFDPVPTYTSTPQLSPPSARPVSPEAAPAARKGTGMTLKSKSSKSASSSLLGAVFAEDGLEPSAYSGAVPPPSGGASSAAATIAAATAATSEAVSIVIDEKLVVQMTRDGAVENLEIKGTLSLTITNPDMARCALKLRKGDTAGYQFQNHPNINKPLFLSDAVLALKNTDREFPTGTPIGILRWRAQSKGDETKVPLTINCWPEEAGGGKMNVNLEYTLQPQSPPVDLNNVVISIPLGTTASPEIVSCDGTTAYNAKAHVLEWRIDLISDTNSSGVLEFNIAGKNPDAFFPVAVAFSSVSTLCDLDVREVTSFVDDSKIRFSKSIAMSVESYVIE